MTFTYTEKNGKKPIKDWLMKNLKNYAEKEHGMKLNVEIKSNTEPSKATSVE